MEACAEVAEFLKAPVGRCIAGDSWLYFYPRIGLCGFVVWGRPRAEDVATLGRVLALELAEPAHVSLVDMRRVESVEAAAFKALEDYVRAHREALSRVVTKLALVRPHGMMGAVTAGFFSVQAPPYPVEVFEDAAPALAWLGVDEAFAGELERAIELATGAPPLLRGLRAWIGTHLDAPAIGDAAHALGTSERTLQRKLREHETTFQNEVNLARIEAAKRLLLDTDTQLTRIALDIGCGSLPAFSSLFRKLTGEAPSAWRSRMRNE
ncbi:MAG: helix-turn-helix transcriptional regulator [Polyangiaceae bacterium]